MPGFLVQAGATLMCPHGGQVQVAPGNATVTAGKQPVALLGESYPVLGCKNADAQGPSPCVEAKFDSGTSRVKISGKFALVQSSTGMCTGSREPGPPIIVMTQLRVKGL